MHLGAVGGVTDRPFTAEAQTAPTATSVDDPFIPRALKEVATMLATASKFYLLYDGGSDGQRRCY